MDGRDVMAGHSTAVTQELAGGRVSQARAADLGHVALFYGDDDEYRRGLAEFVHTATAASAPLHVALPWHRIGVARDALAAVWFRVALADMSDLGRNPARLIPAGQGFVDDNPGKHVYCLWEPAWPDRSAAEQHEIVRHEGLVNLALCEEPMTVLCLYDTAGLSRRLIADIERTHPFIIANGQRRPSESYLGPDMLPESCDEPLPPPGPAAESLSFTDQIGSVREFATARAAAAGLSIARTRDLMLAVSEVAGNAVAYAQGGVIQSWHKDGEFLCQIEDSGYITDPLAGLRQRPADNPGGHGLWLTNLLCDLVERRTSAAGTTTRLHMRTGS